MSALTITKVVEFDTEPTDEVVLKRIKEAVEKEFDSVKLVSKTDKDSELRCRVKTKLLNPIVSLKGPLRIQTKANKAKVMVDADTTTNGWFWFTLLFGFAFPPLWALMFVMYFSQKKASMTALEKVFERVAFDASF